MNPQPQPPPPKPSPEPHRPVPAAPLAAVNMIQPSSPSRFALSATPTAGAQRRIAIAVDLSDESAYAVKWAVQNYLRRGDAVILLHVRPTSVLYGADWGAVDLSVDSAAAASSPSEESQQKLENDFDNFTTTKAADLAQPLVDAQIPFKIHIVKDHDMKERLCLEVERLGLSAVIMGSRGFGASRRNCKGRLGSVSDYCVHHCICPVVVVRYPEENDGGDEKKGVGEEVELHPVPEEEQEYHDADDEQKGLCLYKFQKIVGFTTWLQEIASLPGTGREVVANPFLWDSFPEPNSSRFQFVAHKPRPTNYSMKPGAWDKPLCLIAKGRRVPLGFSKPGEQQQHIAPLVPRPTWLLGPDFSLGRHLVSECRSLPCNFISEMLRVNVVRIADSGLPFGRELRVTTSGADALTAA